MEKWLTQRLLIPWATDSLRRENKSLREENQMLHGRIAELESYIRGLHLGLRGRRKQ